MDSSLVSFIERGQVSSRTKVLDFSFSVFLALAALNDFSIAGGSVLLQIVVRHDIGVHFELQDHLKY